MIFMTFNDKLFVITHVLVLIQSIFTTTYILLKAKKAPVTYSMLVCKFLLILWIFFRFPECMSTSTEELLITVRFTLFPIFFIGVSWFIFALFYTEKITVKNKKLIILLVSPIAICYLPALTNKYFYLIIVKKTVEDPANTEWGLFFWIFYVINNIYVFGGIFLVLKKSINQYNILKKQIIVLVFSVLIPCLANIIGFVKVCNFPFDITPLSFAISLTLLSISIFKFKFLDIYPFAMKEVFNNMKESVIITDSNNNIIDYNRSFLDHFDKFVPVEKDQNIKYLLQSLEQNTRDIVELDKIIRLFEERNDISMESEMTLDLIEKKHFSLYTKPVLNKKNTMIGRIITFNDITNYKKLYNELNDKNEELYMMNTELTALNEELYALNEQLKDYSQMVEQLTLEKERNRFARDMHDTLGHTLTMLITLLKVTQITYSETPDKIMEKLSEAIEIAQAGMKELRRVVSGLNPETLDRNSLLESLKDLIIKSNQAGTRVELSIQGEEYASMYGKNYSNVIYRTCQEALTNSVRHGQAKNVSIILNFSSQQIKLYIFDDGKGCEKIVKNKGLSGMEERVKSVNGTVIFGSGDEGGFNINVVLPYEPALCSD